VNSAGSPSDLRSRGQLNQPTIAEDHSTTEPVLLPPEKLQDDRILECFKKFDKNNDGKISRDEMASLLQALDKTGQFNDDDVQGVMDEVDESHDGFIDYAEFTKWLQGGTISPQARLDLALEKLRKGEQAAMPPAGIEATVDEAELFFFLKKDQKMEDACVSNDSTVVHQISPTSNAFKAGVRFGMHVVGVAGRSMDISSNHLDQIVKLIHGGSRTARSCKMQFMTPADIRAHRGAMQVLEGLVEEVREAKEVCDRVSPGQTGRVSILYAYVSVKYYNDTVRLPLVEGRIETTEIDNVFGLSRLMPKCKLYLVEEKSFGDAVRAIKSCKLVQAADETDTHIMSDKEVFLMKAEADVIQAEGEKGTGGVFGTFYNLVPNRAYSLMVEPGLNSSSKEVARRKWMLKKENEERLSKLPQHDCSKEQIPFGIHVSTEHDGEFAVEIDNREGRSLGMNVSPDTDNVALRVEEIVSLGLVAVWNVVHPHFALKHGDRIMEINGKRGVADLLMSELKKHDVLNIKVRRFDFDMGDHVLGLFSNSKWYSACITKVNPGSTFTLQWFDGREEERIKGPFELKKENERNHVCHTRVQGDYWFVGAHNNHIMYKNSAGAIMNFKKRWRINFSEESDTCYYVAPGETGVYPPQGSWPSPANPGRIARVTPNAVRVCGVCTVPVCELEGQ